MIVIPLGWLASANSLPCPPSWGLQTYALQIVHTQGILNCAVRNDLFGFYLQIKLLQPFEHQLNMIQHFVFAGGKYTDVI